MVSSPLEESLFMNLERHSNRRFDSCVKGGQQVIPCQLITSLFISWPPSIFTCNRQPTTQTSGVVCCSHNTSSLSLEALTHAISAPSLLWAFPAPPHKPHPSGKTPLRVTAGICIIFLGSINLLSVSSFKTFFFFWTGSHLYIAQAELGFPR